MKLVGEGVERTCLFFLLKSTICVWKIIASKLITFANIFGPPQTNCNIKYLCWHLILILKFSVISSQKEILVWIINYKHEDWMGLYIYSIPMIAQLMIDLLKIMLSYIYYKLFFYSRSVLFIGSTYTRYIYTFLSWKIGMLFFT